MTKVYPNGQRFLNKLKNQEIFRMLPKYSHNAFYVIFCYKRENICCELLLRFVTRSNFIVIMYTKNIYLNAWDSIVVKLFKRRLK